MDIDSIDHFKCRLLPVAGKGNYVNLISPFDQRMGISHDAIVAFIKRVGQHAKPFARPPFAGG
jgi:hypothetical protein